MFACSLACVGGAEGKGHKQDRGYFEADCSWKEERDEQRWKLIFAAQVLSVHTLNLCSQRTAFVNVKHCRLTVCSGVIEKWFLALREKPYEASAEGLS